MHANTFIKCPNRQTDSRASAGIRHLTHAQMQRLRAFVHKRVLNPHDADDILQATLVEALRNEHKFQHASKPETWLCGIALNLVRNHFRRHYSQAPHECWSDQANMESEQHEDVGHLVDGCRQLQRTFEAMENLPANMRQVIKVSLAMDGNYQDTARSLGVPIGTVRSRLSRARDQLRQVVNPFG